MTNSYNALIIGGGPAGSTAALLLARAGWNVALVEARTFPRRKVCGEYLSATNWPLLRELGIADDFRDLAGPPVERTAVFAGNASTTAKLPCPHDNAALWGRALGREHLDALLLDRAISHNATLYQPWRCTAVRRSKSGFHCQLESRANKEAIQLAANVVVAAHGSWELGELITQRQPAAAKPGDWMAFKAHFRDARLPSGLMPLLSFVNGYGGMVHADEGRTSISCCLRREQLESLPREAGRSAGDAVLRHILKTTSALRPVFEGAALDDAWLAAGPIQPGLRSCYRDGLFVVGNAAGEAHPVVAEGISMAMQSSWLLAERLIPERNQIANPEVRDRLGANYQLAWRRSFSPRIRNALAIAHWASRPKLVRATLPLLRGLPALLTYGAQLSGKTHLINVSEKTTSQTRTDPHVGTT